MSEPVEGKYLGSEPIAGGSPLVAQVYPKDACNALKSHNQTIDTAIIEYARIIAHRAVDGGRSGKRRRAFERTREEMIFDNNHVETAYLRSIGEVVPPRSHSEKAEK